MLKQLNVLKRLGSTLPTFFFLLILITPMLPISTTLHTYLMQAAVGGLLVSILFRWQEFRGRFGSIIQATAVRAFLLYLGWVVIAFLVCPNPARGSSLAVAELIRINCGVIAFVGVGLIFRKRGDLRAAGVWIPRIGCALAIVSIAMWLTGTDIRSQGFNGNPQILAAILALFVPFAFVRSINRSVASVLMLTVICLALLLTGTRSSCVAAICGSVIVLFLSGPPSRIRIEFSGRVIVIAIAVLTLVTAIAFSRSPLLHRLRLSTTNDSVADRITVWKAAAKIVSDHPLTGTGVGSFPLVVSQYSNFYRLQSPARVAIDGVGMINLAHNEYLQIAADLGVPALMLFAATLVACSIGLRKTLATTTRNSTRRRLIATLGLLATHAVDCLANPATHFAVTDILFWALLGFGFAATITDNAEAKVVEPRFHPLLARLQIPLSFAAFALCLGCSLTNIGWAYPFSNLYIPGSTASITPLLETGTWGSNIYSAGPSTIASKGGGITSLAMALNGAGINNNGAAWNPGTLNTFMNAHSTVINGFNIGDYVGNSVDWSATVADARKVSTSATSIQWAEIDRADNFSGPYIGSLLTQGYPVIANVQAKTSSYGQAVLINGLNSANTHFVSNDPITGVGDMSQQWYNTSADGYLKNGSDLSEINVSVADSNVSFVLQLTNPTGLITKYNSSLSTNAIPNSSANAETFDDEVSGATPTDLAEIVQVLQPASGQYSIQLSGSSGITYAGHVDGYSANGTRLFDTPFSGTFANSSPATIPFTYTYSVPEPTGLILLVGGLGSGLLRRRRGSISPSSVASATQQSEARGS